MRVIGIDPGTLSIDLCGLDGGQLVLDRTIPTADALADPDRFIEQLHAMGPVDLIAGPSGYGLPLINARDLTPTDIRLAYLNAPGESGGLHGLSALATALSRSQLPVVFLPGVIHLPTVPDYRKINRVDLGTADKVCAVALGLHEESVRRRVPHSEISFILVELGGAFTAAIAVEHGRIVDGVGGTSGPIGMRSAGAWDGEVAFLAGTIEKATLFTGGVRDIHGEDGWTAYIEGIEKAVAALTVSVPHPDAILLSGRVTAREDVVDPLTDRLRVRAPVRRLEGFARTAKHAAQGAALIADGLAGGTHAPLVDALALRTARGTVLDHLVVISPDAARQRLGLT